MELHKVKVMEKDIKITVTVREATEICRKALFEHVSNLGMKNVTCEKWYLNCKRKGIVFKGQKNGDDKLAETGTGGSQGSRKSEPVSKGRQ